MTDLELYNKILSLPPDLRKEAEDFIDFLIEKTNKAKDKSDKKAPVAGLAK